VIMGVCRSRINDQVTEDGVNKEISAAHDEQQKSHGTVESAGVSTAMNSPAKLTEVQEEAGNDAATLNYDDEVTITYEQFQDDMKPMYSTWAETLFVNLRESTKNKASLQICDVGCGDGNNCRMVMDRVAELNAEEISIIGIDISSSQIELAKSKTYSVKKEYDGIRFEVGSAQNIPYKNTFDVAFSMWPFGYAENVTILQEMMTSCFECLKPSGVCIGVTSTMEDPSTLRQFEKVRKEEFDFVLEYEEPLRDGAQLIQHCGKMHFEEVFYHKATYEKVAKAAGFKTVRFIDFKSLCYDPSLSPSARKKAVLFMEISPLHSMFVLSK